MGNSGLSKQTVSGQGENVARCAAKLATAIDSCGQEECPQLLFDAIACIVPFDVAMVVTYSRDEKPLLIHDTFTDAKDKRGLNNYINQTYILNPVYNAFLRGLAPGVYRVSEVAPDDYFNSEHFRNFRIKHADDEELIYITDEWPRGMGEIFLACDLLGSGMLEFCLLRSVRRGGFNDDHISRLNALQPVIGAAFRLHLRTGQHSANRKEDAGSIEEQFRGFGGDILTPRESEVAELILKGHSGHSIGDHLSISITTVKTHRKNLYSKFGISTQQELFSYFLTSLQLDVLR